MCIKTGQFFQVSSWKTDRQTHKWTEIIKHRKCSPLLPEMRIFLFHFTIKKYVRQITTYKRFRHFKLTQGLSLQKLFFYKCFLVNEIRLSESTSSPSSNIQQWNDHFKCVSPNKKEMSLKCLIINASHQHRFCQHFLTNVNSYTSTNEPSCSKINLYENWNLRIFPNYLKKITVMSIPVIRL